MIRLEIVGCGVTTRRWHVPAVVAHPEVELVALGEADQEWGQAFSYDAEERHGVLLVTALHWRPYQSTRLPRLTLDEGIIGDKGRVPFRQGLDLTEQWLPWASYL